MCSRIELDPCTVEDPQILESVGIEIQQTEYMVGRFEGLVPVYRLVPGHSLGESPCAREENASATNGERPSARHGLIWMDLHELSPMDPHEREVRVVANPDLIAPRRRERIAIENPRKAVLIRDRVEPKPELAALIERNESMIIQRST